MESGFLLSNEEKEPRGLSEVVAPSALYFQAASGGSMEATG